MRPRSAALVFACAGTLTLSSACIRLSPQLQATDIAKLEQIEDRQERERAYAEHQIYVDSTTGKPRYSKGSHPNAPKMSWQSLDTILRTNASAALALPHRKRRISLVLASLAGMSGLAAVAGIGATAREGINISDFSGGAALLVTGASLAVAFGVASGIVYGSMGRDYHRAVRIYNDDLGVRLGVLTPAGRYRPPGGVQLDDEGYIIMEAGGEGGMPRSQAPAIPFVDGVLALARLGDGGPSARIAVARARLGDARCRRRAGLATPCPALPRFEIVLDEADGEIPVAFASGDEGSTGER